MPPYRKHSAEILNTYNPVGAVEQQFTSAISDGFWRLNKLRAIEFNLLSLEFHEHQDDLNVQHDEAHVALTTALAVRDITGELARLSIYEQRLNRMLHLNIAKLESLQKVRKETQEDEMRLAASIRALSVANGETWIPSDDGFAFSIAEIDAAARRFKLRTDGYFFAHPA